ncbi:putative pectinesterase 67 [Hibiscus syriacus]|uniref:Pectinesterase n=2 Tax=Hibiscus syriacus TaxID=106335 RepID=A0A6A2YCT6_HIBSY|nr:putative pectinesterase 67 [Hibiscus syriacus]
MQYSFHKASKNMSPMNIAFASVLAIAFCFPCSVDGKKPDVFKLDAPFLTKKLAANLTITVDAEGGGDYKTVQEAVNAVPNGNSKWVIIHVKKGVYREKVHVPKEKRYIFMRGNGKGKTGIIWSQSSVDNKESATFSVEAKNFIAFGISFKNEAPTGVAYTSQNQSVAAFVGADMVAFYHCAFFSTHNTLFDYKGRHYYDSCYIQGSIDFIFGRGRTMFHNCEIFVLQDKRIAIHGSITAQNRANHEENSGFVFLKGKVYGIGYVYLGRAKGKYSTVVFAHMYLSKTIVPEGWTDWSYHDGPDDLFHAEYKNHGPGADMSNRAHWVKKLTDEEAKYWTTIDFIKGTYWLPAWLD